MDVGLDIEAYKDYVNNLKQFAHLNFDYQLFANESMQLPDEPEFRELVIVSDPVTGKDRQWSRKDGKLAHEYDVKLETINLSVAKLKREGAAFL